MFSISWVYNKSATLHSKWLYGASAVYDTYGEIEARGAVRNTITNYQMV